MTHKLTFWENKDITFEESKKYSSRTEFCKGSYGAYRVSKKNGWLNEMTWLNRKNVYKDPVDVVYRYYFPQNNAIYVGRTIYPKLRDYQHKTVEKDTVYKFAKENSIEIPPMEIIEEGLTVLQGAEREAYWEKHYRKKGFIIINKQPCGSLGLMCRGKWSKEKCFEEARKYKSKSEFRKNCNYACTIATKKGWINEMDWLHIVKQRNNGYWKNKDNFLKEAKKYESKKELEKNNLAAYVAGWKYGYLEDVEWKNERKTLPFNYWKDKEHCIEESKKYNSRNEFRKGNQSAYWASLKYGYIDEMDWLTKRKSVKRGFLKNKELILEEARKYNSRSEFRKNNRNFYEAACRYGYLDEIGWTPNKKSHPKGYWDNIDNVIKEVRNYKSKKELKEKNSYLYKIIFKKGYIDKLTWLK
jgi:hypothetical protein